MPWAHGVACPNHATPTKIICSSSRESFVNELYPSASGDAELKTPLRGTKNEACGVNGNEHTYRSAASRQSGIGDKKTPHQFYETSGQISPLLRARPVAFGQRWTGGRMKPAIKCGEFNLDLYKCL